MENPHLEGQMKIINEKLHLTKITCIERRGKLVFTYRTI